MKVVSTEALTKLIQLVKSAFIKVDDVVEVREIDTETPSEVTLADVATSGSYNDLSNKPTIPTVNDATLTIQKNGSNVATFTANASSNVTANISVPTVDQTYSAISTNAQSGVAVASAISTKADSSTVSNINSRVTTIESEIPAQASASNQLADKNFVNSSIATNTATFIGTFNSVTELEAYTGAKDDNDYAFVISTDAAGNTLYNRYKWNGTAWLFEYALNNSSFTANQWAAINSGATTANIGQIATKADDNAVVHKTGNETIGGTKTFTNGMITQNIIPKGNITLGTSTNTWGKMVNFQDTTGKRIARIQPMAVTTTNNRVGMWVNNADNTVEKGIYVDSDGTTSAPTPSAGDNSTKIATTAFVKAQGYAVDSNVVHKTGDETIGGRKTYTNSYLQKNTALTKGTLPSSANWWVNEYTDKNGSGTKNRLACMEYAISTNGDAYTYLRTYKYASNNSDNATLSIVYPNSGNPYATCPTPTENNTSSIQIDTVGARNTQINTILSALYPVGSIYIGTQSTCPLATLISGSTWELVSAGRVLQGSDSGHNAGTTIEAGLPNHTHHIGVHNAQRQSDGGGYIPWDSFNAGSVIVNSGVNGESGNGNWTDRDPTQYNYDRPQMTNASDDNSIYGNSNTVQPPAYVVNIWRRTA